MLFWGTLVLACIGVRMVESRNSQLSIKIEAILFWAFGAAMVFFAAFRPIGIARDDVPYLNIYSAICPSLECGQWVQGARDWGWYSLVGLLKSIVLEPKVMLWLGAVGLFLKLGLMYSLIRRPLLVLLLYLALYYEIQDLTALRVSMAIAVFMLGIWFVARYRTYRNGWALFLCGLFHKQAFIAPLILVGVRLRGYRWLLITLCIVPILFTALSLYPDLQQIFSGVEGGIKGVVINQGLDAYFVVKNSGAYQGLRNAPLVVYPQILLILWLLLKGHLPNNWLESLISGCLVMGCFLLWAFASLPDAQVRFFEFIMVPTVLLAGVRRLDALEVAGVVAVSAVFVLKYNVLHHLLV